MWLLRTDADQKPIPVLLVYFTGATGWHNRRWESKLEGNAKQESRSSYRLVSQGLTLELIISHDQKAVWIQGREYPLGDSNVYLVRDADKGSQSERIEALGRFTLPHSTEEPLALLVLRRNPELAEKLK